MYADAGFDDILYGFPFIPPHLERVTKLTSRLEMFHVMVTSEDMCQYLAIHQPPEGKSWSVFLKVDIDKLSYNCQAQARLRHSGTLRLTQAQTQAQ